MTNREVAEELIEIIKEVVEDRLSDGDPVGDPLEPAKAKLTKILDEILP